jgi:hypothetical protein
MNLKRERFYRDWYKPRRPRVDRVATSLGAATALFLLLAILVSQCEAKPATSRQKPETVHYLALNGDKMIRLSDDGAVVRNYWDF